MQNITNLDLKNTYRIIESGINFSRIIDDGFFWEKDIKIEIYNLVLELISSLQSGEKNIEKFPVVGRSDKWGGEGGGVVYALSNTGYCAKIAEKGKYVGENQEGQFILNFLAEEALKGEYLYLHDLKLELCVVKTELVLFKTNLVITVMPYIKSSISLWDSGMSDDFVKTNFSKKVRELITNNSKGSIHKSLYEIITGDINGNNLLLDLENKKLWLIDPYVGDEFQISSS